MIDHRIEGNTGTAEPAAVVLEDGRIFRGRSFGAAGAALGEAVFCTGMTGYQETLTDPSYHRQIVVATAPQIGNTGWNDEDGESGRIQVAGYVVRDPSGLASSWRSTRTLAEELVRQGVVAVSGVDTRALTRHLRDAGAMRAGLFTGEHARDVDAMLAAVTGSPGMAGANLAGEAGTTSAYTVPAGPDPALRAVVLDLGAKAAIVRSLTALGVEVHVLPPDAALDDVLDRNPDGVLLSNGPGDPSGLDGPVRLVRGLLERRTPVFGICLGHQVLGMALGLRTYKMHFGHRGLNVPVIDTEDGRVLITAQNHGFALRGRPGDTATGPFGRYRISHHCPNDGTVEGLRCLDVPAFSVQFHPEAAAGPHDAGGLFDDFVRLMSEGAAPTKGGVRAQAS